MRSFRSIAFRFALMVEVLYQLIALGWIIYGLKLYFSSKNDCKAELPMIYMVVTLILGSLGLLVLGFLLCVGPCLYLRMRREMDE